MRPRATGTPGASPRTPRAAPRTAAGASAATAAPHHSGSPPPRPLPRSPPPRPALSPRAPAAAAPGAPSCTRQTGACLRTSLLTSTDPRPGRAGFRYAPLSMRRLALHWRILIALAAGLLVGLLLNTYGARIWSALGVVDPAAYMDPKAPPPPPGQP